MTVSELSERQLVARIQQRLAPPPAWMIIGIGDDAAVVEPVRNHVDVMTVDAIVEGVHFDRRFTPPDAIGHRALAVNLSDLAAMGAAPRLALLSFALPPDLLCVDFDRIVDGLVAVAAAHRVHVAGGNLTRSPAALVLDVTAVGAVKRRSVLRRTGAKPGDELYVTGEVGGALAGLQYLRDGAASPTSPMTGCVERYLYPQPRLRAGTLLARNRAATACMDLSDGLADGVRQIAELSQVGMTVDPQALPIPSAACDWYRSRGEDPILAALGGGDDYELLFTVNPKQRGRLREVARHGGVPLTRIGVCTKEPAVIVHGSIDGTSYDRALPSAFSHLR